ncbi:hypothetical protein A7P21_09775 [Acinetobacter seifertii]|nr:hypothetical protein A7P21_09775 [Acinetobacter seifertii]
MEIYKNSPMTQAIFKLFQELEDWLTRNYSTLENGSVKCFIFGGCALHIHTNARGSNDLDAEIQACRLLKKDDVYLYLKQHDVEYLDENDLETNLEFDPSFNTALASIDPDYEERVIPLVTDSIVEVYLVSGLDLAVSKLARLSERDIEDIKILYKHQQFTLDTFKKSADNALEYYATPEQLRANIHYMASLLAEMQR